VPGEGRCLLRFQRRSAQELPQRRASANDTTSADGTRSAATAYVGDSDANSDSATSAATAEASHADSDANSDSTTSAATA
jgi:hypothetical protein